MKKRIVFVVLALFLIVLLLFILSGYAPVLFIRPVKTGQIENTNIYAIRNGIGNAFLINTNNGYIMIDAGFDMDRFAASITEIGINTADVKWIFLTHSDRDHVAALPLFPNAEIYMSEDEMILVNGTIPRNRSRYNSIPDGIDIENIIHLSNEQELFLYEITIKTIKAPGHTPGSMLYLVNNQYLFTGDAFKVINGNLGNPPFTMDKELAIKTIEQLRETIKNSSIILTSHYGLHYSIRN